jgi:hypothetical protein
MKKAERLRSILVFVVVTIALFLIQTSIGFAQESKLNNPLNSNFSTIPGFIAGALRILVMVALPIISLFIVYAGFKFISAQGNPNSLTEAKNNFFYVILGAILILGAWVIATLIGGTVTQLTAGQ